MDKAGAFLDSFFSFFNFQDGKKYVSFFSSWQKIVGDDKDGEGIFSHSKITDINKGALLVEVDHPGWMQQLRMRQERILKKIASEYPDLGIKTLHYKLVPEGKFSSPAPAEKQEKSGFSASYPEKETPEQPPPLQKTGKDALESIQDENLRESLIRLKKTLRQNENTK